MLLQAIVIEDRAYEAEKAARSFINDARLPRRLPALAWRSIRRSLGRATDLRRLGLEDITAHYPETLRALARALPGGRARRRRARLRRALPAAVGSTSPGARAASASGASATCQMLLAKPGYRRRA